MKLELLVVALAVAGCGTSYREALNEQGIGRDRWFISAEGNHWTDRATLTQYAYERAGKRCPEGFEVLDAEGSPLVDRLVKQVDGDGVVLIVRCKASASAGLDDPDMPQAPEDRPRGWWCTERGEVGACAQSAARCERQREAANEDKDPADTFAPCAFRQRAVCAESGCFTTPETCVHYEKRAGRTGAHCVGRDE